MKWASSKGFTIVELLIVVVVIAILAAITIVSYNGIRQRATEASIQNKESQAAKKVEIYKLDNGTYPQDQATFDGLLNQSPGDTFYTTYSSTPPYDSYTLSTSESGEVGGGGAIADGATMQTITTANCPSTRVRVADARDSHSYWIQKLSDGKCWMLTNLAYAGGGANTYSDTRTLANGTAGTMTNVAAMYYVIPSATLFTTEPTNPSTMTDGTGQYGYLYNWCGAMGRQLSTSACTTNTTPLPDTSISVCPAGWRLPTNTDNEFTALNTAVNSGSTTTDAGMRSGWLGQRSGLWSNEFMYTSTNGFYWTSTQYSGYNAYRLNYNNTTLNPASNYTKSTGFAVRCLAN